MINVGILVKILDCIVIIVNSLVFGFGFKKFSSNKMWEFGKVDGICLVLKCCKFGIFRYLIKLVIYSSDFLLIFEE